jgi:hypothetical protein
MKKRRRILQLFKETSTLEFLTYFKPNLQKFIKHTVFASWQDKQARLVLMSLPEGITILHLDFVETYLFAMQNEIQSAYYHSYHVILMLHITYCMNLDYVEGG